MALCEHANTASEDAVLFSMRDWPAMEAAGFYRRGGGGEWRHQEAVGMLSPE